MMGSKNVGESYFKERRVTVKEKAKTGRRNSVEQKQPQMLQVWNIFTYIYHKFKPDVG